MHLLDVKLLQCFFLPQRWQAIVYEDVSETMYKKGRSHHAASLKGRTECPKEVLERRTTTNNRDKQNSRPESLQPNTYNRDLD